MGTHVLLRARHRAPPKVPRVYLQNDRRSTGRQLPEAAIGATNSGDTGRAVYYWCMTRVYVDIDDRACAEVMRRYRLATKREAITGGTPR